MTPEWVAAIASVATFIVIGATALAALAQLRHAQNTNQIAVFTEIRHRMETPDVGNFIDGTIAPLVKHGMVDRTLACDLFYFPVVMCWDALAPYVATCRAFANNDYSIHRGRWSKRF